MVAAPKRADLVLSGGGVKGIGLVGAVAALVDAGYAPQRISGTSAGALVGAVVAAAVQRGRVNADELQELAMEIDYRKFLDPGLIERIPVVGPAWGVLSGTASIAATHCMTGWRRSWPTSVSRRSPTWRSPTAPLPPSSATGWW